MSDNAQTAATTATGNPAAPAQPASGQANSLPPTGKTITDDDYQRFTRYEQQVKGFSPYQERLARLGIKRPEDLDRFSGSSDAPPRQETQPEPQQHKPEDVRKIVAAELARERHAQSRQSESELIAKVAKELAGEDADEFGVEDAQLQVEAYIAKLRSDDKFEANYYPQDHPLREEAFAPIGDKHVEKVKGWWTERMTKREAARMQQTAKDANRPARPRPSPAGSSGGQGKPNDKSRSPHEHIDSLVDEVIAGR